jgi:dihydrofolate reductase
VTWWARNYSDHGVPDLVHITAGTCEYLDQAERIAEALRKRTIEELRHSINNLEYWINLYIDRRRVDKDKPEDNRTNMINRQVSMIAVVGSRMEIGYENRLLWNIPEDLRWFQECTLGKTVVMGRNTWLSLPKRPLPGRTNVVLTQDLGETFEGALAATSIEETVGLMHPTEENFVIGGASVYAQFMPMAQRLYITRVFDEVPDADAFFPEIDVAWWDIVRSEYHLDNAPNYVHFVLERRATNRWAAEIEMKTKIK